MHQFIQSASSRGSNSPHEGYAAPIPLASLSSLANSGNEPEFTTYAHDFSGTLDYIFALDGGLKDVVRISAKLELPKKGEESLGTGLPNLQHPSDHLPIGFEISFSSK